MPSIVPDEANVHSKGLLLNIESPILRGPPRKPLQSGHALWVSNLPLHTDIILLKDHFSLEATENIRSVFLISKRKSAFVNYRTREALLEALGRFYDSNFGGVR